MRNSGPLAVWALALGLGFSCSTPARSIPTPGEAEAARARELARTGRCREALQLFDYAIPRRRGDSSLLRDRGYCHQRLGSYQPAIADFERYLAASPRAPDAQRIRERVAKLKALVDPLPRGDDDPNRAPKNLEDPFALDEEGREKPPPPPPPKPVAPTRGFLLGAHGSWHDWSDQGLAEPTWSVGGEAGYAVDRTQLDLRLAFSRTGNQVEGFGVSFGYSYKLPLNDTRRWELLLGVGAGYQGHANELDRTSQFFHGRITPRLSWVIIEGWVVQAGPELGMGLLDSSTPTRLTASQDFAMFYGGFLSIFIQLPSRQGSAGPARPVLEDDSDDALDLQPVDDAPPEF